MSSLCWPDSQQFVFCLGKSIWLTPTSKSWLVDLSRLIPSPWVPATTWNWRDTLTRCLSGMFLSCRFRRRTRRGASPPSSTTFMTRRSFFGNVLNIVSCIDVIAYLELHFKTHQLLATFTSLLISARRWEWCCWRRHLLTSCLSSLDGRMSWTASCWTTWASAG